MRKKSSIPPAFHVLGAMAALGLAVAAAAVSGTPPAGTVAGTPVRIVVEHRSPSTLFLRATSGRVPGLMAFSQDGSETLLLSVPDGWAVQEVRGGPLSSVPADPPSAGYRRWRLPTGITLTLRTRGEGRVTVENPSGVPLLVRHTLVPLSSGEAREDSVLVTEKPVTLW